MRKWWSEFRLVRDIPPKIILRKKKTDGRIGLKIKQITLNNPQLPYRDYKAELIKQGIPLEDIPHPATIHRFVQANGFKVVKLLKRPLLSERDREKRLQFARDNLGNSLALEELM